MGVSESSELTLCCCSTQDLVYTFSSTINSSESRAYRVMKGTTVTPITLGTSFNILSISTFSGLVLAKVDFGGNVDINKSYGSHDGNHYISVFFRQSSGPKSCYIAYYEKT